MAIILNTAVPPVASTFTHGLTCMGCAMGAAPSRVRVQTLSGRKNSGLGATAMGELMPTLLLGVVALGAAIWMSRQ